MPDSVHRHESKSPSDRSQANHHPWIQNTQSGHVTTKDNDHIAGYGWQYVFKVSD